MAHLDIVADILQRMVDRGAYLQETALREIEAEVRADWGGERIYIEKIGDSGRLAMMNRDRLIRESAAAGVPEDYLSLRYNLTVARIRQIVRSGG